MIDGETPMHYDENETPTPRRNNMTITATFIRTLDDYRGDAQLWKLSEPVRGGWSDDFDPMTEFVIVSAVCAAFDHGGSETFIFAADETGEIINWAEMPGSQRGTTDHEKVIRAAGWGIA